MRPRRLAPLLPLLLAGLSSVTGCASSYVVPGRAADMNVFLDPDLRQAYARQAASPLPARIAVVRVQEPGYRSHTADGYGQGRYSVVTVRDVEDDDGARRIGALPDVAGVVALNRLVLSSSLQTDRELRVAAARLGADMLLIYTFDTGYRVADGLRPLTVVSLGLFPTKVAHVTTTASALLMDVRTGYVYGSAETTSRRSPLANAWTSADAVDGSRRTTERDALGKLVTDFERIWPQIVAQRRQSLARRTGPRMSTEGG